MKRQERTRDDNSVQRDERAQSGGRANHHATPWGRGPLIFRAGTSAAAKRRRVVFCTVALIATAALIWPIYPRFATIEPMIAGLPFGLAWVIAVLAAMFVNILFLFRGDLGADDRSRAPRDPDGEAG